MSRLRHYLTLGIIATVVYQASALGFFQGQVAEAAFFNTGAIDLLSGRKAFTTEATTIDNLYPLSVSGGLGRTVDASIGGYNATNNVLVVSQATGTITVNLAIPAGTYSIDLGARFGKDSTNGEEGEQLRITSGSSSFNIPDQGDNFIFDNYHFEGFLVAENQTNFQIRGTGEGEVELGDIRISGTSTAANTTAPLAACAVTMNPTSATAGTEVSFHVSATGGSATKTFAYDFNGDGSFDLENTTGTAPFTYTRPGSFTVNIRVTDTIGGL
nr:PKD domain-containing protein [Candidatus Gracilibacteria bacterium]